MPLIRKTMIFDNRIIVTNPSQMTKSYSISNEGIQQITHLNEEVRIRKFMISDLLKDNK